MKPASGASWVRPAAALALLVALFGLLAGVTSSARLERADFTYNNGAEVQTLDPATVTGVPEGRVMRAIYEGLIVQHPKTLEPLPGMASSWELSPDGKIYTFEIREDAVWSNGEPVTAHDFAWSWERLLHPNTAAEYVALAWLIEGGRQYTLLDDRFFYTRNWLHPAWMREMPDGRVRIGVTGYLVEDLDGTLELSTPAKAGDELDRGDVLLELPSGTHYHVPIGGKVVKTNDAFPILAKDLLLDPYEEGWILELEPEPMDGETSWKDDQIIDAATYRTEYLWPQRVGIRTLGDKTLEVELESPAAYFLNLVGFYPFFPVNRGNIERAKERWPDTWQLEWVRPENIVTNGPFLVAERRVNDRIRLRKNPLYWDADNVAMRTIDILPIEHFGTMMNLYLTGEVSWIDRLATNLIPRLIEREDFDPQPYLGSWFYRVNVTRPPLDDKRVRQALALTIDRRAICEKIEKAGQLPNWALNPNGLTGYTKAEMAHAPVEPDLSNYDEAFAADCDRARELLQEAGFGAGGKEFPTIELHYNTSEANRDICEVVADGWKRNLGIDAKLLNQEWKVYLDTQTSMNYDVSRAAWIGDYADPTTFLDMFRTGDGNNRTGFSNRRYDELLREASFEVDPKQRMQLLHEAEALLMDELPILPVYNYVTRNLRSPRLGGFYDNLRDEHSPKFWYWMDDEELAAKRAAQPAEWKLVDPGGPKEGLYPPSGRENTY